MRRVLQSWWLTPVLLVIVGIFAVSIMKMYPQLISARDETLAVEKRLQDLRNSQKTTDTDQNEARYLEQEARLKLNYKKVGERVVILSGLDEDDSIASPSSGMHNEHQTSNIARWWQFVTQ